MKIRDGYLLREIVDSWVVVPIGERVVQFNGIISLSETGAFIWKSIEDGKDVEAIVDLMTNSYDVDKLTAKSDILGFISLMKESGLIE